MVFIFPMDGELVDRATKAVDLALFQPAILVLDFVFAAHFWSLYVAANRLAEARVQLLLTAAWISFLVLVPFAYVNVHTLEALTDISETTMVLTLVMQVMIITRDAMRQCNLESLRYFMRGAEVFCVTGIAVTLLSVVDIKFSTDTIQAKTQWRTAVQAVNLAQQNTALVFIVTFRYFYIALSRGSLLTAIRKHSLSTSLYALLVTHEYPFIIARAAVESSTPMSWKHLQGFYMRVLVLLCIWANARDHARARARRRLSLATRQTSRNRRLSSVVPQSSFRPSGARQQRRLSSALSRHSLRKVYQLHSPVVAPQPNRSGMSAFMSSLAGAVESLPR